MSSMTDIHDIRPPEIVGMDPALTGWVLWVAAACALAGIAVWAWRRFRKRGDIPTVAAELLVPPEEKAFERLIEIAGWNAGDGRLFYFALSEVLRTYIGERFGLDAMEKTTEELTPAIAALPLPPATRSVALEVLAAADPVKFAGVVPDFGQRVRDLDRVRTFVSQTVPKPEPPEPQPDPQRN